jgi:hypothetical protein
MPAFKMELRELAGSLPRRAALLFLLSALASIWLGFFAFNPWLAQSVLHNYGYWLILGNTAWFGVMLWLAVTGPAPAPTPEPGEKEPAARSWPDRYGPALAILGVTALCVTAEPMQEKILYDEHVLQSTAQHMHLNRQVATTVRAYEVNGVFLSLQHYLDKRPSFFPLVLSLTHDLTGYRVGNAFILNAVLTLLTLWLLFLVVRRLTHVGGGILAVLLFGTVPLLGQNTTGAGLEILNLAMILLCVWLGFRAIDAHDRVPSGAFVLGVTLLAQTRYESALYIIATALILPVIWWRRRTIVIDAPLIAAPLLLVPIPLTQAVLKANPIMWDLREGLESRFSLMHLGGNLDHAFRFFSSASTGQPNSIWLTVCGTVAITGLLVAWLRRPSSILERPHHLVVAAFGLVVLLNLGLLMFYFWGELDDPMVSRLALPLLMVMAIAAAVWLARLDRRWPATRWALIFTLISVPLIYGRATPHHTYTAHNIVAAEQRWEMMWVEARGTADRIILSNKSCLPWILNRVPSLLLDHARDRGPQLRFQIAEGNFHEILVMQRLEPVSSAGGFKVRPDDALPPGFQLETLAEKRFGATRSRISRLMSVDMTDTEGDSP